MPCQSDHCEATANEVALGQVLLVLDLLAGRYPKTDWDSAGYDPRVYNSAVSDQRVDKATARACAILGKMTAKEVRDQEPEVQLWWKRHQEQDRERERREAHDLRERERRERAALRSLLEKYPEEAKR